jgi:hypothetical protein
MKNVLARQQPLAQRPLREIPEHTIPERFSYLLEFGPDGTPTGLRGDRYEFTRQVLDMYPGQQEEPTIIDQQRQMGRRQHSRAFYSSVLYATLTLPGSLQNLGPTSHDKRRCGCISSKVNPRDSTPVCCVQYVAQKADVA